MFGNPTYNELSDTWKCEICGQWYKGLGYHIARAHKMTVREYNKTFGFDLKQVFLSKEFKKKKRDNILRTGVYKNLEKGQRDRYTKKQGPTEPNYERSEQTKQRLRVLRKKK